MAVPASDASPAVRLFLALWPDEDTREALARWQHEWNWPPAAARVRREGLHLTLHFIGNVATARVPAVAQGLEVPFRPITLELNCAEVWPNGAAVLRPLDVPEPLAGLHAALSFQLAALGLAVEQRAFRPHVTLARRARGARPPARERALRWKAHDGYVLVHSLAGGRGYEVLRRYDAGR